MRVCKGGLKEARGATTWAGLGVKGGGEGSCEMGRVDKVQRTGVLRLGLAKLGWRPQADSV